MFWVIQTLNGISFGMLLFLLAAGLSLIYGLMKILNLTHGSFYLWGGYIGLMVVHSTGSLFLAALLSSLAIALSACSWNASCCDGCIFRSCRKHCSRSASFSYSPILRFLSGAETRRRCRSPPCSATSVQLGDFFYPSYRLFIIAFGLLVAALLWWLQEGTRLGAMLRAGVDDEEIARALGINVSLLFTLVFALGAFLAALGGTMGGPIMGVYPGADFEVMLLGFVVVIVGGLGSLKGALVGGLIVGLLDNFGKVFFPEFALFTIFAPMALILAVRPHGLFGRE